MTDASVACGERPGCGRQIAQAKNGASWRAWSEYYNDDYASITFWSMTPYLRPSFTWGSFRKWIHSERLFLICFVDLCPWRANNIRLGADRIASRIA